MTDEDKSNKIIDILRKSHLTREKILKTVYAPDILLSLISSGRIIIGWNGVLRLSNHPLNTLS